jgi:hypothetical protein
LYAAGVEDDARLVALEDLAHLRAVAAVAEDGRDGGEIAVVDELALDVEERRLGLLDEHEPRRPDPRDLAAELRADRAARTGHHHGLADEVVGDDAQVDFDLLAAEHVLDLHGPDLPGEVVVTGDQLVDARQRLDGDAGVLRRLDDVLTRLAGRGGIAISTSSGGLSRRMCGSSAEVPSTRIPCSRKVLLARVVVDQPDRRVAERGATSASRE